MPQRVHWIATLILSSLFILSACGDKATNDDNNSGVTPSPLQVSVVSSSITLDENRVVLAFWDGQNRVADVQSVKVKARLAQDTTQTVLWEGTATNYNDYEIPYWVAYPELTESGAWFFDLTITQSNDDVFANSVAFNVQSAPRGIPIGQPAFPSESRTWDGESDLKLMTSADEPNPAYYEKTIAEALAEDKPLIIAFSTPGLCTSKICAPVMRSLDPFWVEYSEQINFIHVEVYADFETLAWVSTMQEWELQNEPWVYVVDSNGLISTRFDGPVAPSELAPYVEAVLIDVE